MFVCLSFVIVCSGKNLDKQTKKTRVVVGEMARGIKVLAKYLTKSEDLSSIPETHIKMAGDNRIQKLSFDTHMCSGFLHSET